MSFVVATQEAFAAASKDLTAIGSAINTARGAAARSTTQVGAAARDEVSAATCVVDTTAALFADLIADPIPGRSCATVAKASGFTDTKDDTCNSNRLAKHVVPAQELPR